MTSCSIPYLFLHPPPSKDVQLNLLLTMPPKASKKATAASGSPPKTRSTGRKHAGSSLDTAAAPPNKKLATMEEGGEFEGEGEGDEGGSTTVKKTKGKAAK